MSKYYDAGDIDLDDEIVLDSKDNRITESRVQEMAEHAAENNKVAKLRNAGFSVNVIAADRFSMSRGNYLLVHGRKELTDGYVTYQFDATGGMVVVRYADLDDETGGLIPPHISVFRTPDEVVNEAVRVAENDE